MKLLHQEPNWRGASWRSRFDSAPLSDSTRFAPYHRLFLDSSNHQWCYQRRHYCAVIGIAQLGPILFSWKYVTSDRRCANGSRQSQKMLEMWVFAAIHGAFDDRIRAPGSLSRRLHLASERKPWTMSRITRPYVPYLRHAAERAKRFASPTPTYRAANTYRSSILAGMQARLQSGLRNHPTSYIAA